MQVGAGLFESAKVCKVPWDGEGCCTSFYPKRNLQILVQRLRDRPSSERAVLTLTVFCQNEVTVNRFKIYKYNLSCIYSLCVPKFHEKVAIK